MCSSLRLGANLIDKQCTQTGLKNPKKYTEDGFTVKIHLSTHSDELNQYYEQLIDYSFVYPQHTQMYDVEGCAIFVQDKNLDLYSKTAGPENFGSCLLEYERHLTRS